MPELSARRCATPLLNADLHFRTEPPETTAAVSYIQRKSTEEVRNRLVGLLRLPDLYALDRLDLSVETSVDPDTQARVANVMERLSDPAFLRSAGMYGRGLLNGADPSKIAWSFVLYERGDGNRNHLRVHADSLNRPFDINSGSKLQLGSTAKLRTLATYLEIIAKLHQQLADVPARDLSRLAASADDALSGWAASYLARASDRSLQPMLEAALQRRYSAAPEEFFTGGGSHVFENFARWEDHTNPTVIEAFEQSVNLAFIRLLRDVLNYYIAENGIEVKRLLADPDNPRREEYLQRFVEADSRRFLYRYYRDYKRPQQRRGGRGPGRSRRGGAAQAGGGLYDALSARADRRPLQIPRRAPAADAVHRGAALGPLPELLPGQDVAGRSRLCRRRASARIVAGALPARSSRCVVGRSAGSQRAGRGRRRTAGC